MTQVQRVWVLAGVVLVMALCSGVAFAAAGKTQSASVKLADAQVQYDIPKSWEQINGSSRGVGKMTAYITNKAKMRAAAKRGRMAAPAIVMFVANESCHCTDSIEEVCDGLRNTVRGKAKANELKTDEAATINDQEAWSVTAEWADEVAVPGEDAAGAGGE